jgi:hypothetical protein
MDKKIKATIIRIAIQMTGVVALYISALKKLESLHSNPKLYCAAYFTIMTIGLLLLLGVASINRKGLTRAFNTLMK